MSVQVWVGDMAGNVNVNGGNAWFNIQTNDSLAFSGCWGPAANCFKPATMGQTFHGDTAETILEGGVFGGSSFSPLSNYGPTLVAPLLAYDAFNVLHRPDNTQTTYYNLEHCPNGDLVNCPGSVLLSTGQFDFGGYLLFTFNAYQ